VAVAQNRFTMAAADAGVSVVRASALFGPWMICASEPSLFPWCALAVVLALLAYLLIRWAKPQPAACVPPTDVWPA
jgi:hypothetical protein